MTLPILPKIVSRFRLAGLARVALALVVVWLVVARIDLDAIADTARHADYVWIAMALALLPVNLLLEALTWWPLLKRIAPAVGFTETLVAVLSGYPLGIVTPARLGDLAGRALSISSGDQRYVAASAAVSRIPDMAVILLAGWIALAVSLSAGWLRIPAPALFLALSGLASCLTLGLVFFPSVAYHTALTLPFLRRLAPKLAFLRGFDGHLMLRVLCVAFARLLVYSGQFLLLAFAFSTAPMPGPTLTAVLLTFLAKTVIPPITYFDLGIREGAAAFFFGRLGLGAATGFDAALLLFAINIGLPAVLGGPLVSRYRFKVHSVAEPQFTVTPEEQP